MTQAPRVLLCANSDWYLFNFRTPLACHLRNCGFEVHLASPDGPWRAELEGLGFPWHPLPLVRGGFNPFQEARTFRAFRLLHRTLAPDLSHHFTLQCVVWGSLAAHRETAVVNALTGLGSIFRGGSLRLRLLGIPVRHLLRRALHTHHSHTIFQNPEDMTLCQDSFDLPPDRTHLIRGSGVNPDRFRCVPRHLEAPRVLFVGRLLEAKGIRDFVAAARELSARHPEWTFQVVGSTDPGNPDSLKDSEVAELAQSLSSLQFLGHRSDMPEILAKAHLMVLPTRYGEGVPRSLIEGAAAGLPLVASDHPGCREIVRPGMNGILTRPRSVPDLVAAIETLLSDFGTWQDFSRSSRALAESVFSEASVHASTLEVYRQALAEATPAKIKE